MLITPAVSSQAEDELERVIRGPIGLTQDEAIELHHLSGCLGFRHAFDNIILRRQSKSFNSLLL